MVDKITNSLINLENKASKNSANVKNSYGVFYSWAVKREGPVG